MTWTVLVLAAGGPAADTRDLEREADLIRVRLGRGNPGNVRLEVVAVETSQEVVRALAEIQPEIVHFFGPGGELILDGGAIGEDELGKLFARAQASPECVLLNAYFTLERADVLLERVRCVVGTPAGEPETTERLWIGFYQGLARGEGWAAAFERGRAAAAAGLPPGWLPRFAARDPEILDPQRGRPRPTAPPTRDVLKGSDEATRSMRGTGPSLRDRLPEPTTTDTTGGGGSGGPTAGNGGGQGPTGGGGPAEWAPEEASRPRRAPKRQPAYTSVDAGGQEPAAGTPLYPLWFGTNRALVNAKDPTKGFSGERDTELHYGTCRVAVPRSHRIGSVGSSWWKRLLRREDDRLRLEWQALRLLAANAFWADLSRALAERHAGQRMGLVVIHGYNVSFEDAARRAAQIGCDLQVPGATAFFSWPSRARVALYSADEATIQASEKHIARFLLEFTRHSGAEAVHVIAHSMGNRGLLRAMQRILVEVGEETRVPFGQILLAAPDEDQEVFAELSAAYGRLARRTTLYVSARDRAVAGSRLVHDAPRVGFTPPVTVVPGIDTVEVTNADVSLLGHGYFAEARDLLHDIHSLLVHDAPPSRRMGLRPAATPDGRSYWVIGE